MTIFHELIVWAAVAAAIGAAVGFTVVFLAIGFTIVIKPFEWLKQRFFPGKNED